MLERIKCEACFLRRPDFADIFVWREALQRLETSAVIVSVDEVDEVIFELSVTIIMIASDGRFLDRPVHALDLTVGPRVLDLSQPMFDPVLPAAHVEHMRHVSRRRAIRVAWRESELNAVVGENRVDLIGDSRDQGLEEGGGRRPSSLFHQLHEGKFAGAVDGNIEVKLALSGLNLGDIDMEEADRIDLELFLVGLGAFNFR